MPSYWRLSPWPLRPPRSSSSRRLRLPRISISICRRIPSRFAWTTRTNRKPRPKWLRLVRPPPRRRRRSRPGPVSAHHPCRAQAALRCADTRLWLVLAVRPCRQPIMSLRPSRLHHHQRKSRRSRAPRRMLIHPRLRCGVRPIPPRRPVLRCSSKSGIRCRPRRHRPWQKACVQSHPRIVRQTTTWINGPAR